MSVTPTERQKVTRKLNQTKKALESAKDSEKSKLEEDLSRYRVDLNYILVSGESCDFAPVILKQHSALSQNQEVHLTIPARGPAWLL